MHWLPLILSPPALPPPLLPALPVGNLPTLHGPVEIPFPMFYEYRGGEDTVPAAQRLTVQLARATGHTGGALTQDPACPHSALVGLEPLLGNEEKGTPSLGQGAWLGKGSLDRSWPLSATPHRPPEVPTCTTLTSLGLGGAVTFDGFSHCPVFFLLSPHSPDGCRVLLLCAATAPTNSQPFGHNVLNERNKITKDYKGNQLY